MNSTADLAARLAELLEEMPDRGFILDAEDEIWLVLDGHTRTKETTWWSEDD